MSLFRQLLLDFVGSASRSDTKFQIGFHKAVVMSEYGNSVFTRSLTVLIIFLLFSIISSPAVVAQSEWQEDGWLKTSLAQERLDNGDEFGCYGIEGLSWNADPGAVALECREYIEQRVTANRWGESPISTFTPDSLTQTQHQIIMENGFRIHGDNTGLEDTVWHSANDTPSDMLDWFNLGRRGGSLEQIIGSKQQVKDAVEEGGLVNLYWIGRVNDATIRHDKDIELYISDEADAWLTTWGQAWSYWSASKCYQFDHSMTQIGQDYILSFESLITEQCVGLNQDRWNVPLTWAIDIEDSNILSIKDSNGEMNNISQIRHTKEGYSHDVNQYLHLSVVNGNRVNITLDGSDYEIVEMTNFWNNHSAAITIAAHETTDLFKWSKRFVDQDDLVFTWLVMPRPAETQSPWMAYVALTVGAGVTLTMLLVLKSEGIGPLAKKKRYSEGMLEGE